MIKIKAQVTEIQSIGNKNKTGIKSLNETGSYY